MMPRQETAFEEAAAEFHCILSDQNDCLMTRGARKMFEAGIRSASPLETANAARQLAQIVYRLSDELLSAKCELNFSARELQLIHFWGGMR